MAWSISISAQGRSEIREQLETWDRQDLIAAITDDKFEAVYEQGGEHHAQKAADAERLRLEQLPHEMLAELAFELVEQNSTCDNAGSGYWIDREGYHKVYLPDEPEADDWLMEHNDSDNDVAE